MIPPGTRVLVLGADQHQGLAVIRGLGRAGLHVVAGSDQATYPAFHSRYTANTFQYRTPKRQFSGFVDDVLMAVDRTRANLIMPVTEATLVGLSAARSTVEAYAPIAAAPSHALRYALDVRAAMRLAERVGVATPAWVTGKHLGELLERASELRAPFVVAPLRRGIVAGLPEAMDFTVRYAAGIEELREFLEPLRDFADNLVVRESRPGVARCVSGVWQRGQPVALFAYERERELPETGGVSVVRRSIRLDEALAATTTRLLERAGWHGVATVEFKYDRRMNEYTFLGIHGRFQASTALCMDAGVNLPLVAASVYLGGATPTRTRYRTSLVGRWMGGDTRALWRELTARRRTGMGNTLWQFVRDFTRASRYDELCPDDWMPSVAGALSTVCAVARAASAHVMARLRTLSSPAAARTPRVSRPVTARPYTAPRERSLRA